MSAGQASSVMKSIRCGVRRFRTYCSGMQTRTQPTEGGRLFVRHLSELRNVDVGFRRDSVLLAVLNPQGSGLNRFQLTRLYRDLLERLRAIPGVSSVSLSGTTPIEGGAASRFANVEGFQERPEDRRWISIAHVAPRYFETLGTPLLAGRGFIFEDQARSRVAI